MTMQKSFRKHTQARMAQTSEASVRKSTGRGWDEWVTLINAEIGPKAAHNVIAAWLVENQGLDGWWAQSVTVGYERITGLRLPGQMKDGTFTVSRTKTLRLDGSEFRELLNDDDARASLLPGLISMPRSKPTTKAPSYSLTDAESGTDAGIINFRLEAVPSGWRLVVTHEKLQTPQAAEAWKQYWADWLEDLAAQD